MQMVKFPARAAADWLLMKRLTKSDAADPGGPHARHDRGDQLNTSSFLSTRRGSTGSREQRSAWRMWPPVMQAKSTCSEAKPLRFRLVTTSPARALQEPRGKTSVMWGNV